MTPVLLAVGVAGIAMSLYAVLGGADFGGGVWDLLATGPRRAEQRSAITTAIGPVWEANHVWLIFVIVTSFTCFPAAYADVEIGLYAPLSFALVGIVLRGAAFVFRNYAQDSPSLARTLTVVFGVASLLAPFFLGDALGGLATGRYAWTSPFALAVGVFAVTMCAQVAAVFIIKEIGAGDLRNDFRTARNPRDDRGVDHRRDPRCHCRDSRTCDHRRTAASDRARSSRHRADRGSRGDRVCHCAARDARPRGRRDRSGRGLGRLVQRTSTGTRAGQVHVYERGGERCDADRVFGGVGCRSRAAHPLARLAVPRLQGTGEMRREWSRVGHGGIAQLVEHLHGMQGVRSSSLLASTIDARSPLGHRGDGVVEESPGFTGQGAG